MLEYTEQEATKKDFEEDGTLLIWSGSMLPSDQFVYRVQNIKDSYSYLIPLIGSSVLMIEDLTKTHVIIKDFIFGNAVYSEVKYSDFLIVKTK